MSVANGHVFFSETIISQCVYRIRQVPTAGGASTILFDNAQGGPVQSLVADNSNVYWADQTTIQSMPGNGGTPTVLMNGPGGFMVLSLSGNTLYWMETLCCSSPQVSTIKSVSTSGGSISVVQGNLGYIGGALTIGNGNLYWTEGGPTLAALGFGRIAKSPLAGGTVETVASGIVSISPRFLMIDQFIYIADGAALKKLPIMGGFPEFLSPLKTSAVVSLNFD